MKLVSICSKPFKVELLFLALLKIEFNKNFIFFLCVTGTTILTPQLEHALECILANRIPEQWQKISYASDKSFALYFVDFCKRFKWIQQWWLSMEMPTSYWLSAFFHPRQFIEAIKLNYARKYAVTIEDIKIDTTVVDGKGYLLLLLCRA